MSGTNVKPIKPDTYKVTVQYKPDLPGDASPWYVEVEQGMRRVGGGWNGTRDEALGLARELIAADGMVGGSETLTMTADGELVE